MRRLVTMFVWIVLGATIPFYSALGFRPAANEPFPNFDQRTSVLKKGIGKAEARVIPNAAPVLGLSVERDSLFNTPRHIIAQDGFLTGPSGQNKNIQGNTKAPLANDPQSVVQNFLNAHKEWIGHGGEALEQASIVRQYTTEHNGLTTTLWQQRYQGVDVFEGVVSAHVTRQNELVALSSQVLPNARPPQAQGIQKALTPQVGITAAKALILASQNIGESSVSESSVQLVRTDNSQPDAQQFLKADFIRDEARLRKVWLPMSDTELRLCWEVILTGKTAGRMYRLLLDATTGEALVRHNLTKNDTAPGFRVYGSDSPTPMSPGLATVASTQPPEVPRILIFTNAINTNASPMGWISNNVYETVGNNVDAHTDRDGNDIADLPRPADTNWLFDFPLGLTNSPDSYANAAVVNLFYWCNYAHDRLYDLGFTEATGNFQKSNFGRGGKENDAVQADGQDGDGLNNASFSSPPDGMAGRLQMHIFSGVDPNLDGCLDAEAILHEYAHGLTERMVGSGYGNYALQSSGLGEGWSDFFALALLSEETDDLGGNYPFAAYISRGFGGLQQNYYFGIRRYPYSTNLAKNPLTLKDIDPGQASPHNGVPKSPTLYVSPSEVHAQGEVWCAMLWDMRANLIIKHGFTNGNRLAMQLVVDSLRLCPSNPNFMNARDGILLADLAANKGANRSEIWAAFAKRGLGFFATVPVSSTTSGVVEDYSMPDNLQVYPASSVTMDGPVGGPFHPKQYTYMLTNTGETPIIWTGSSSGLIELIPNTGTLDGNGGGITVTARPAALALSLPAGNYSETLFFTNTATRISQARTIALRIGQPDFLVELFEQSDFDLQYSSLTFTPDSSESGYGVCRDSAQTLPTDPSGGIEVILGDDWYVPIAVTNDKTVSIWGDRTNVFYISSNGQLALRQGNTNYFEPDLAVFYEQIRAAALYADLHPGEGGKVVTKQVEDRIAVSWLEVPEYGAGNTNTFQIELFFDGRIRMTWLQIDAVNAYVGLPDGRGIPAGLSESDFSNYDSCSARIQIELPSFAQEGVGILTNAGVVSLPNPVTSDLLISLSSSEPQRLVVPSSVIITSGQIRAFFSLEILDDTILGGPTPVSVNATADGYADSYGLITIQDNEQATLSISLPETFTEGEGLVLAAGTVAVSPVPDRNVLIKLSSSDTNRIIVPPPAFVIVGPGHNNISFNVDVLDNSIVEGLSSADIIAEVSGWPTTRRTVHFSDNEPLTLTLTLPSKVGEDFGVLTNAGSVRVSGAMAYDLTVEISSANSNKLFALGPITIKAGHVSAPIDLVVIDNALVDGVQTVNITAQANGFQDASSSITIQDNETPALPNTPEPAHESKITSQLPALSWQADQGQLVLNGDFETGDFQGWTNENTVNGSFIINDGSFLPVSENRSRPPITGRYDALAQQTGYGKRSIRQNINIPLSASNVWLSWKDHIQNFSPEFSTNQQYRVELLDDSARWLSTLFYTAAGSPLTQETTEHSVDLRPWRGRALMLKFVEEDTQGSLNVYLDEVSILATPPTPTYYDVFLGENTNMSNANLVATLTNNFFTPPHFLEVGKTYYWQIAAYRNGVTNTGPVWSFTIQGTNDLPFARMINLTNYTVYPSTSVIMLEAEAFASNGISKVAFFTDSTKFAEFTAPPFKRGWTNPPAGNHVVYAMVKDQTGTIAPSAQINIIVTPVGGAPVSFVPSGSTWKYLDDGSDTGTEWREKNFDDADWKTGRAQFGYGDGDETTVVDFGPDPYNKYITTYFRTTFTNLASLNSLKLKLLCDDGAVVWINGRQVLRYNMVDYGIISFNTRARTDVTGSAESTYQSYDALPSLLTSGLNTVAVEVHQYTNNSPDISFDFVLEGVGNLRPSVQITSPQNGAYFQPGTPVHISANAFDAYGRIQKVDFYANNLPIGTASSSPYLLTWTNVSPGYVNLFAVATDNSGTTNHSDHIEILAYSPKLSGISSSGGQLKFAWPSEATASGVTLESTPGFNPPMWLPITNTILTNGNWHFMLVPMESSNRFFRLKAN